VNINDLKENYFRTIRLRLRENPCLNARIGTLSNSDEELADNIISCLATVTGKLPRGAQHIKKVYMKTTMGSSVLIE
ncbi:hypothetical protein LCGC14_2645860, partial [marine sediment metagenome]